MGSFYGSVESKIFLKRRWFFMKYPSKPLREGRLSDIATIYLAVSVQVRSSSQSVGLSSILISPEGPARKKRNSC